MFFIDTSEPPKIASQFEAFDNTGILNCKNLWIEIHYKEGKGYFGIDISRILPCPQYIIKNIIKLLRMSEINEAKENCRLISDRLFYMIIKDADTGYCHSIKTSGKTGYKQLLNAYKILREFEKELNYEVQS